MVRPPFLVLFEDNHLLAIAKPPTLPTMGVSEDRPSALALAKQYIKQKYEKPGNVYLGVVSRLDAPVTGVLLFARTSKAAARLAEQFRQREVRKLYWALVEGCPQPPEDECVDWMRKDERHRRMHIASADDPQAQQAKLRFRLLRRLGHPEGTRSLLEVELETGRKHQIRLQLSARGHPVVGDRKYGAKQAFSSGIALHGRQLELTHPVQKTPLTLTAPTPSTWRKWL